MFKRIEILLLTHIQMDNNYCGMLNLQEVAQNKFGYAELAVFVGQFPEGVFERHFTSTHGRYFRVFQLLPLRLPGSNLRFAIAVDLGVEQRGEI